MAEVDGIFKEIGSIYASEIIEAFVDGQWQYVTHSMRKGHAQIPNFLYGGF
jgi:intein-encoded DNA endonuclease-like protein